MKTITVKGRTFRPVKNSTIEHDFTLMGHIRASGIDQVSLEEGEALEGYATRLFNILIPSGRVFPMLGCILMPEEMEDAAWTPNVGKETEEFLKGISEPEDKLLIEQEMINLVINFFHAGILSLKTSPKSLTVKAANPGTESAAHSTSEIGES